ncbi:MAG: hypothetical protein HY079_13280 [Elusimicrobia bacterium]|nr:hypothetical protein [Elusimicrobiota bacterium]
MANENDDVLKANQGAPAADIPDLKKKDKERKRAGAAWSGARGAAGDFTGATGGTVSRAAASAASAAAEGAAVGLEASGGVFGGLSRFLAGLTSTLLGKVAVAAAAFMMMAGAGLVGYSLLKGGDAGLGVPNLGGISNSMKVRAGGNDRMGVASNGELRFDPLKPNAPAQEKKAEPAKAEETPATDLKDHVDADAAKSVAGQDKLAHNLSGAKLSSSLGGEFGGKNIFGGNNAAAPKFNDGMAKVSLPKMGAQKGKLGGMQSKTPKGTASTRNVARGKTSRAIGQLRLAKGMSMLGAQAGSAEGASSSAQGAFDQGQTQGGELNTPGAPGDGTVAPNGVGAPDVSMPSTPDTPTGYGVDPGLQNALNQIGSMADAARQMQQQGEQMLIIGAAIMIIGYALIDVVWTAAIGAVIIAIGAMIMGMGYMMMQMAKQMAEMAKSMGSALSAQTGNTQQGQIINECTDQALAGTQVSNCHPSEQTVQGQQFDQNGASGAERVRHIGDDTPSLQQ